MDSLDAIGDTGIRAEVDAWFAAAGRDDVIVRLRAIHDRIDAAVSARRPMCIASGHCCRFDAYGHRLYATGLETAWCVASLAARRGPAATTEAVSLAQARGDCPFLVEGRLCGARFERPVGCRVYFCDRSAQEWQHELAESAHRSVRDLHERCSIPYRYGEWRQMLALVCARRA